MKTLAFIKYFFTAVGAAMLIAALYWVQSTRSFVAAAAVAQGTVIDLEASRSDNSTTWRPVVRFNLPDGRAVQFSSSMSSNPPSYHKGERVEVLYQPSQPYNAKINGFLSLWGGPLIVGGLGAVFFLIGGGILVFTRVKAQRDEYLKLHGVPIRTRFQNVELNQALAVNGANPFRIVTQWQNPATSEIHLFHSNNLWFDPSQYLVKGQDITVFIEQGNPKKYFVDVSFLPKLAG